MSERELIPEAEEERNLCIWCDNLLSAANSYKNLVCQICYRRFISVGLSDEEIFVPKLSKSKALIKIKKANG